LHDKVFSKARESKTPITQHEQCERRYQEHQASMSVVIIYQLKDTNHPQTLSYDGGEYLPANASLGW
jgi:hypothetical protein